MSSLPFGLSLKNGLKAHSIFHSIFDDVYNAVVKAIKNVEEMKNNPEVVLLIANLIENSMKTNTTQLDKKDLCIQICDKLWDLSDAEKGALSTLIQFDFDSGLIKKRSWLGLAKFTISDYFKSKS